MFSKPLFKQSFFVLILVAILHYVATVFFFYWTVYEFDSLMHFLGGVWVSLTTLWLYFFSDIFSPSRRRGVNFLIVSLLSIVVIGLFWEVFELLFGITTTSSPEYVYDTTLDLIMDTLGAICACMYAYIVEIEQNHNKELLV